MKLVDKKNNNQIIRRSSLNSYNVNKYGKQNNQITLTSGIYTHKIYNKIVKSPDVLVSNESNIQFLNKNENKVPIFYKDNNISITKENFIIDKNGNFISEDPTTTSFQIYGQGKAKIVIDPFDNLYKFTIYNLIGNSLQVLDLGTSLSYYLVFIDKSGRFIKIENIKDQISISNPIFGQIAFKISKNISKKILGFTSREFYITSVTSDGTETKIYSGTWQTTSEFNNEQKLINESIPKPKPLTNVLPPIEVLNTKPSNNNNILIGEQNNLKVPISNVIKPIAPYKTGSNSILNIKPINLLQSGKENSKNGKDSSNNNSNKEINTINLAALADSIAGKEAQGLSVENIVNYYFTPGSPGALLFKGIKPSEFLYSVLQIHPKLSPKKFDPIYIQYCNVLGFPVSDDPINEENKRKKL